MDHYGLSANFSFEASSKTFQSMNAVIGSLKEIDKVAKSVSQSVEGSGLKAALESMTGGTGTQRLERTSRSMGKMGDEAKQVARHLKPLKAEFRALKAEASNITFGDITDDKAFEKARKEVSRYEREMEKLERQIEGTSAAERTFSSQLQKQRSRMSTRTEGIKQQREAMKAAEAAGTFEAVDQIAGAASETFKSFATDATLTFAGFDEQMAGVAALTGAQGEKLKDLRDLAKEMGATTKFAASEAAEAQQFLAMAGFKSGEILEALPATLSLAAAGGLDLAASADIASNVLSAFNLKASETAHVADTLAKVAGSANTSVEQLGIAFSYAAVPAANFGVSMDETAAFIGTAGNIGIQGSSAGTAMRGGLTNLADAKKQKEFERAFGESVLTGQDWMGQGGKFRNIVDIVGIMRESLYSEDYHDAGFEEELSALNEQVAQGLLDPKDMDARLKEKFPQYGSALDNVAKVFGKEAMSFWLGQVSQYDALQHDSLQAMGSSIDTDVLAKHTGLEPILDAQGNVSKDIYDQILEQAGSYEAAQKYLTKVIYQSAGESQGAAAKMQEIMSDNMAGTFKELGSAIESFKIAAIEPLKPLIQGFTKLLQTLIGAFAGLPEPVRMIVSSLTLLIGAFTVAAAAAAPLLTAFFTFQQAASVAAIASNALQVGGMAPAFIGDAIEGFRGLNFLESFFDKLNINLKTQVPQALEIGKSAFRNFGVSVAQTGTLLQSTLLSPLGLSIIALTSLYFLLEKATPKFSILGTIISGLSGPAGFLVGLLEGLLGGVIKEVSTILDKFIGTPVSGVLQTIGEAIKVATENFSRFEDIGRKIGETFVHYLAFPIVYAADRIIAAWKLVVGLFEGVFNVIYGMAALLGHQLRENLNHGAATTVKLAWENTFSTILAIFDGIKAAIAPVVATLRQGITAVVGVFTTGISTSDKLIASWHILAFSGVRAWRALKDVISGGISTSSQGIWSSLTSDLGVVSDAIKLISLLWSEQGTVLEKLGTTMQIVWATLLSPFPHVQSKIWALEDNLRSIFSSVQSWLSGVGEKLQALLSPFNSLYQATSFQIQGIWSEGNNDVTVGRKISNSLEAIFRSSADAIAMAWSGGVGVILSSFKVLLSGAESLGNWLVNLLNHGAADVTAAAWVRSEGSVVGSFTRIGSVGLKVFNGVFAIIDPLMFGFQEVSTAILTMFLGLEALPWLGLFSAIVWTSNAFGIRDALTGVVDDILMAWFGWETGYRGLQARVLTIATELGMGLVNLLNHGAADVTASAWERTFGVVTGVFSGIGKGAQWLWTQITTPIGRGIAAIGDFIKQFWLLGVGIAGVAAGGYLAATRIKDIATIASIFGRAAIAFLGGLTPALVTLGILSAGLFLLWQNNVLGIQEGFNSVISFITNAINSTQGLVGRLTLYFDLLRRWTTGKELENTIPELQTAVGEDVGRAVGIIASFFSFLGSQVEKAINNLDAFSFILLTISSLFVGLTKNLRSPVDMATRMTADMNRLGGLSKEYQAFSRLFSNEVLQTGLTKGLTFMLPGLVAILISSGVVKGFETGFANFVRSIPDIAEPIGAWLNEHIVPTLNLLVAPLTGKIDSATQLSNYLASHLLDQQTEMEDGGTQITKGWLRQGTEALFSYAETVNSFVDRIIQGLRPLLDISLLGAIFDPIGEYEKLPEWWQDVLKEIAQGIPIVGKLGAAMGSFGELLWGSRKDKSPLRLSGRLNESLGITPSAEALNLSEGATAKEHGLVFDVLKSLDMASTEAEEIEGRIRNILSNFRTIPALAVGGLGLIGKNIFLSGFFQSISSGEFSNAMDILRGGYKTVALFTEGLFRLGAGIAAAGFYSVSSILSAGVSQGFQEAGGVLSELDPYKQEIKDVGQLIEETKELAKESLRVFGGWIVAQILEIGWKIRAEVLKLPYGKQLVAGFDFAVFVIKETAKQIKSLFKFIVKVAPQVRDAIVKGFSEAAPTKAFLEAWQTLKTGFFGPIQEELFAIRVLIDDLGGVMAVALNPKKFFDVYKESMGFGTFLKGVNPIDLMLEPHNAIIRIGSSMAGVGTIFDVYRVKVDELGKSVFGLGSLLMRASHAIDTSGLFKSVRILADGRPSEYVTRLGRAVQLLLRVAAKGLFTISPLMQLITGLGLAAVITHPIFASLREQMEGLGWASKDAAIGLQGLYHITKILEDVTSFPQAMFDGIVKLPGLLHKLQPILFTLNVLLTLTWKSLVFVYRTINRISLFLHVIARSLDLVVNIVGYTLRGTFLGTFAVILKGLQVMLQGVLQVVYAWRFLAKEIYDGLSHVFSVLKHTGDIFETLGGWNSLRAYVAGITYVGVVVLDIISQVVVRALRIIGTGIWQLVKHIPGMRGIFGVLGQVAADTFGASLAKIPTFFDKAILASGFKEGALYLGRTFAEIFILVFWQSIRFVFSALNQLAVSPFSSFLDQVRLLIWNNLLKPVGGSILWVVTHPFGAIKRLFGAIAGLATGLVGLIGSAFNSLIEMNKRNILGATDQIVDHLLHGDLIGALLVIPKAIGTLIIDVFTFAIARNMIFALGNVISGWMSGMTLPPVLVAVGEYIGSLLAGSITGPLIGIGVLLAGSIVDASAGFKVINSIIDTISGAVESVGNAADNLFGATTAYLPIFDTIYTWIETFIKLTPLIAFGFFLVFRILQNATRPLRGISLAIQDMISGVGTLISMLPKIARIVSSIFEKATSFGKVAKAQEFVHGARKRVGLLNYQNPEVEQQQETTTRHNRDVLAFRDQFKQRNDLATKRLEEILKGDMPDELQGTAHGDRWKNFTKTSTKKRFGISSKKTEVTEEGQRFIRNYLNTVFHQSSGQDRDSLGVGGIVTQQDAKEMAAGTSLEGKEIETLQQLGLIRSKEIAEFLDKQVFPNEVHTDWINLFLNGKAVNAILNEKPVVSRRMGGGNDTSYTSFEEIAGQPITAKDLRKLNEASAQEGKAKNDSVDRLIRDILQGESQVTVSELSPHQVNLLAELLGSTNSRKTFTTQNKTQKADGRFSTLPGFDEKSQKGVRDTYSLEQTEAVGRFLELMREAHFTGNKDPLPVRPTTLLDSEIGRKKIGTRIDEIYQQYKDAAAIANPDEKVDSQGEAGKAVAELLDSLINGGYLKQTIGSYDENEIKDKIESLRENPFDDIDAKFPLKDLFNAIKEAATNIDDKGDRIAHVIEAIQDTEYKHLFRDANNNEIKREIKDFAFEYQAPVGTDAKEARKKIAEAEAARRELEKTNFFGRMSDVIAGVGAWAVKGAENQRKQLESNWLGRKVVRGYDTLVKNPAKKLWGDARDKNLQRDAIKRESIIDEGYYQQGIPQEERGGQFLSYLSNSGVLGETKDAYRKKAIQNYFTQDAATNKDKYGQKFVEGMQGIVDVNRRSLQEITKTSGTPDAANLDKKMRENLAKYFQRVTGAASPLSIGEVNKALQDIMKKAGGKASDREAAVINLLTDSGWIQQLGSSQFQETTGVTLPQGPINAQDANIPNYNLTQPSVEVAKIVAESVNQGYQDPKWIREQVRERTDITTDLPPEKEIEAMIASFTQELSRSSGVAIEQIRDPRVSDFDVLIKQSSRYAMAEDLTGARDDAEIITGIETYLAEQDSTESAFNLYRNLIAGYRENDQKAQEAILGYFNKKGEQFKSYDDLFAAFSEPDSGKQGIKGLLNTAKDFILGRSTGLSQDLRDLKKDTDLMGSMTDEMIKYKQAQAKGRKERLDLYLLRSGQTEKTFWENLSQKDTTLAAAYKNYIKTGEHNLPQVTSVDKDTEKGIIRDLSILSEFGQLERTLKTRKQVRDEAFMNIVTVAKKQGETDNEARRRIEEELLNNEDGEIAKKLAKEIEEVDKRSGTTDANYQDAGKGILDSLSKLGKGKGSSGEAFSQLLENLKDSSPNSMRKYLQDSRAKFQAQTLKDSGTNAMKVELAGLLQQQGEKEPFIDTYKKAIESLTQDQLTTVFSKHGLEHRSPVEKAKEGLIKAGILDEKAGMKDLQELITMIKDNDLGGYIKGYIEAGEIVDKELRDINHEEIKQIQDLLGGNDPFTFNLDGISLFERIIFISRSLTEKIQDGLKKVQEVLNESSDKFPILKPLSNFFNGLMSIPRRLAEITKAGTDKFLSLPGIRKGKEGIDKYTEGRDRSIVGNMRSQGFTRLSGFKRVFKEGLKKSEVIKDPTMDILDSDEGQRIKEDYHALIEKIMRDGVQKARGAEGNPAARERIKEEMMKQKEKASRWYEGRQSQLLYENEDYRNFQRMGNLITGDILAGDGRKDLQNTSVSERVTRTLTAEFNRKLGRSSDTELNKQEAASVNEDATKVLDLLAEQLGIEDKSLLYKKAREGGIQVTHESFGAVAAKQSLPLMWDAVKGVGSAFGSLISYGAETFDSILGARSVSLKRGLLAVSHDFAQGALTKLDAAIPGWLSPLSTGVKSIQKRLFDSAVNTDKEMQQYLEEIGENRFGRGLFKHLGKLIEGAKKLFSSVADFTSATVKSIVSAGEMIEKMGDKFPVLGFFVRMLKQAGGALVGAVTGLVRGAAEAIPGTPWKRNKLERQKDTERKRLDYAAAHQAAVEGYEEVDQVKARVREAEKREKQHKQATLDEKVNLNLSQTPQDEIMRAGGLDTNAISELNRQKQQAMEQYQRESSYWDELKELVEKEKRKPVAGHSFEEIVRNTRKRDEYNEYLDQLLAEIAEEERLSQSAAEQNLTLAQSIDSQINQQTSEAQQKGTEALRRDYGHEIQDSEAERDYWLLRHRNAQMMAESKQEQKVSKWKEIGETLKQRVGNRKFFKEVALAEPEVVYSQQQRKDAAAPPSVQRPRDPSAEPGFKESLKQTGVNISKAVGEKLYSWGSKPVEAVRKTVLGVPRLQDATDLERRSEASQQNMERIREQAPGLETPSLGDVPNLKDLVKKLAKELIEGRVFPPKQGPLNVVSSPKLRHQLGMSDGIFGAIKQGPLNVVSSPKEAIEEFKRLAERLKDKSSEAWDSAAEKAKEFWSEVKILDMVEIPISGKFATRINKWVLTPLKSASTNIGKFFLNMSVTGRERLKDLEKASGKSLNSVSNQARGLGDRIKTGIIGGAWSFFIDLKGIDLKDLDRVGSAITDKFGFASRRVTQDWATTKSNIGKIFSSDSGFFQKLGAFGTEIKKMLWGNSPGPGHAVEEGWEHTRESVGNSMEAMADQAQGAGEEMEEGLSPKQSGIKRLLNNVGKIGKSMVGVGVAAVGAGAILSGLSDAVDPLLELGFIDESTATYLESTFETFGRMSALFGVVTSVLGGVGSILAPIASGLGAIVGAVTSIFPAIQGIIFALTGAAVPIWAVVGGIAAVIAGLYLVNRFILKGIFGIDIGGSIADKLEGVRKKIVNWVVDIGGKVFGMLPSQFQDQLIEIWEGMQPFLSRARQLFSAVTETISASFHNAIAHIGEAWQGFVGRFSFIIDPIVRIAKWIANALINALNHNPTERIPEAWDGAVNRIKELLMSLPGAGTIAALLTGDAFEGFNPVSAFQEGLESIGGWFTDLPTKATEAWTQLSTIFSENPLSGLADSFSEMFGEDGILGGFSNPLSGFMGKEEKTELEKLKEAGPLMGGLGQQVDFSRQPSWIERGQNFVSRFNPFGGGKGDSQLEAEDPNVLLSENLEPEEPAGGGLFSGLSQRWNSNQETLKKEEVERGLTASSPGLMDGVSQKAGDYWSGKLLRDQKKAGPLADSYGKQLNFGQEESPGWGLTLPSFSLPSFSLFGGKDKAVSDPLQPGAVILKQQEELASAIKHAELDARSGDKGAIAAVEALTALDSRGEFTPQSLANAYQGEGGDYLMNAIAKKNSQLFHERGEKTRSARDNIYTQTLIDQIDDDLADLRLKSQEKLSRLESEDGTGGFMGMFVKDNESEIAALKKQTRESRKALLDRRKGLVESIPKTSLNEGVRQFLSADLGIDPDGVEGLISDGKLAVNQATQAIRDGLDDRLRYLQRTEGANIGELFEPGMDKVQGALSVMGGDFQQFGEDAWSALRKGDFEGLGQSFGFLKDNILAGTNQMIQGFGSMGMSAIALGIYTITGLSPVILIMIGIAALGIAIATNFLGIRTILVGVIKVVTAGLNFIAHLINGIYGLLSGMGMILHGLVFQDFAQVREGAKRIVDSVVNSFRGMARAIAQAFAGALQIVEGLLNGIGQIFGQLGRLGQGAINMIMRIISLASRGLLDPLRIKINHGLSILRNSLGIMYNYVRDIVRDLRERIEGFVGSITKKLERPARMVQGLWNKVSGGRNKATPDMGSPEDSAVQRVKNYEDTVNRFGNATRNALTSVASSLSSFAPSLSGPLFIAMDMVDTFASLSDSLPDLRKGFAELRAGGIDGTFAALSQKAPILTPFFDFLKKAVLFIAPVVKGFIPFVLKGVAMLITAIPFLGQLIALAGLLFVAFKTNFLGIGDFLKMLWTGLKNIASRPFEAMKDEWSKIKDVFAEIWQVVANAFAPIGRALDSIVSAFTKGEEKAFSWGLVVRGLAHLLLTPFKVFFGIIVLAVRAIGMLIRSILEVAKVVLFIGGVALAPIVWTISFALRGISLLLAGLRAIATAILFPFKVIGVGVKWLLNLPRLIVSGLFTAIEGMFGMLFGLFQAGMNMIWNLVPTPLQAILSGIGDAFGFIFNLIGAPLFFAEGGPVPGVGSGDTVPAMLTPGEYVVRKGSAQRYARVLEAINEGFGFELLPSPVAGPSVPSASSTPPAPSSTKTAPPREMPPVEININVEAIHLGGAGEENAREFLEKIAPYLERSVQEYLRRSMDFMR